MNTLAHIDSKIWAILPSELNKLRATASTPRADLPKAIAPKAALDTPVGGLNYGSIAQNGVATINVQGVLYNPEGFIDDILEFYFGGTSTPGLIADVDRVTKDSSITSVIFNFHSPGGDVFGINEAADKIAALTAKKPTMAYCYGLCCSAAYFLAAKCGEIVTDDQALIGSLGVVASWVDFTGYYEMNGIAYEEVTSQNAPYKRLDIRKAEDRSVFMDEINGIESVFLKSVAKGRGVPLDTVKSDFGKGAVMAGNLAVKAGLADRTGSLDEVIKELSNKRKQTASATADAPTGDIEMGFKDEFKKFASTLGFKVEDTPESEAAVANADTEKLAAEKAASDERAALATAELETVKAAQAETAKAQIAADATAFTDAELKAGRLFPAEKEGFIATFEHLASADAASPLETGSRLDTFKAMQANRKPHGLTEEVIDAEANQIMLAGIGGDVTQASRKEELLEMTPLGRAALKLVKNKAA